MNTLRAIVLVALSSCLCACAESGTPSPVAPSSNSAVLTAASRWQPKKPISRSLMTDEEKLRLRRIQLSAQASAAGLGERDIPDLVRWIYPEEIGATVVPCLVQKGFPVTANASGTGYGGGVAAGQDAAFALAEWECSAMYSVDSRLTIPPSDEQMGVAYNYVVDFVIPCLTKLGYGDLSLPSRAVFVANDGYWDAYPRTDEAEEKCPLNPPTNTVLGELPP